MSDLQQAVHFGANVDPTASDPGWPLSLTHAIEHAGLELIGIQDHPYNAGFLDTWSLIATLLNYWVDEITRLVVEVGMDTFIYWPAADHLHQIEWFAAEVVPAVREQVARAGDRA